MKKILRLLLGVFLIAFSLLGCGVPEVTFQELGEIESTAESETPNTPASEDKNEIQEDGQYTDKDSVALYIHTYGKLPSNFVTKREAQDSGWNNKENTLDQVLPGRSIGGDRFGNYEGLLPKESGRDYKECDIDYKGGSRNAKRIVFSNDGLIFYTDDHYKSFTSLY